MAKVVQTLRTHWKKSIFFSGVAVYGGNFGKRKWDEYQLMREYCHEALAYGQAPMPMASAKPYHVTVILNPACHGGKGATRFEKYCAPVLHLAGIKVSVIRTEGQGMAKDIMGVMTDTDAVLVAGGDGTLMEAVTGFLRRNDCDKLVKELPIGVLPVGFNNKMARNLFPGTAQVSEVKLMAESAMSVVKQLLRHVDVIEVANKTEGFEGKPLYGLRQVQVGAFTDAHERRDKYWYWAGLKKYVTYFWSYTVSASKIMWNLPSHISSGTYEEIILDEEKPAQASSWWSYIIPQKVEAPKKLTQLHYKPPMEYNGSEITIESSNNSHLSATSSDCSGKLKLSLGPDSLTLMDYMKEGFRRERNVEFHVPDDWMRSGQEDAFLWQPDPTLDSSEDSEKLFYLDNESVDIRGPIQVSILPNKLIMFCSDSIRQHLGMGHVIEDESKKKWWQRRTNASSLTKNLK